MKITSKKSHLSGATLIDAMVAMAVFGILAASLFGGVAFGFQSIGTTREELRANQILLEKMETIRLYSWQQLNTPGYVPTTFTESYYPANVGNTNGPGAGVTYQGTVTIAPGPAGQTYSAEVKEITVQLTWTNGNRTIGHSISTFVSRGGLQRYIY